MSDIIMIILPESIFFMTKMSLFSGRNYKEKWLTDLRNKQLKEI